MYQWGENMNQIIAVPVAAVCVCSFSVGTAFAQESEPFRRAEQYRLGPDFKKNAKLAFQEYLAGANAKHVPSMLRLAWCYQFGFGTDTDLKSCYRWTKLAADLDNPEALLQLAILNRLGCGCEQNFEQAKQLLLRAIDKKSAAAVVELGNMYETSQLGDMDIERVIELYNKASDLGDDHAKLALIHLRYVVNERIRLAGNVSPIDTSPLEAFTQIKSIYEKNNSVYAMYCIYLYQGIGCVRNTELVDELIERGVNRGEREAFRASGYHSNEVRRFELLKQGSESGFVECMHPLANAYGGGIGTTKDLDKYAYWIERAAELNQPTSLNELGTLSMRMALKKPAGNEQDAIFKIGRKYLELGAQYGNVDAMFNLGYMFEKGHGVSIDYRLAEKWYSKAADSGHSQGTEASKRVKKKI